MSPLTEKRMLQVATALACFVPLSMGVTSVLRSAAVLKGVEPPLPIDLDSHFRYLSGLLLGFGLCFLVCLPTIEKHTALFRAFGLIVLIGGLARLYSALTLGLPGPGHIFGLFMELGTVPLLVIWQGRVARLFAANAGPQTR